MPSRLSGIIAHALALLFVPLLAAHAQSIPAGDWPFYNRTLAADRYSALDQITAANVGELRRVCLFDTREQVS